MNNDFSPLFGPAWRTTKNIITNLLHNILSDQRTIIPKNLQAGRRRVRFFANGVQRSDLPKQGSDFIMWIPSDNEATLQRPHVSFIWPESRAVYSTTQGMKDLERDYPASRGAWATFTLTDRVLRLRLRSHQKVFGTSENVKIFRSGRSLLSLNVFDVFGTCVYVFVV